MTKKAKTPTTVDDIPFDNVCPVCNDKGADLPMKVCRSAAGWYIGQFCDGCGPYSRVSPYYATEDDATIALVVADVVAELIAMAPVVDDGVEPIREVKGVA